MYQLKWDEFHYTRKQFGAWRITFGAYLAVCYLRVYPYAVELFGQSGAYPRGAFDSRGSFFPKFVLSFDSDFQVKALVVSCIALSLMILFGFYRRFAAALLWLAVIWMYNRTPNTDSPEYPFVNWLIFACIFIPEGEAFSLRAWQRKTSLSDLERNWRMPRLFYWGAWIVLSVGYFFAASSKFRGGDHAWMDGTAMYYVFVTDNARLAWYGSFFDNIPIYFFIPVSYMALSMQALAPVFIYFRKLRPWWWLVSTATHLSLLFFANLGQLTLGMVFFHFFLLDHRWVESLQAQRRTLA